MNVRMLGTSLATASIMAFLPAAALSQTSQAPEGRSGSTDRSEGEDETTSSDIIVTAQRRAERVVDVPISITVASQAQLERQQVNTVADLNRIAPSLEIQSAPGQNTGGGGAIRGIGTQTFNAGATASVGVVVDQVSQGNANIGDLFDVARIEVLKGPQGTLFGLTTSAGVINITTNAPDPTGVLARFRTELSDRGTLGSGVGNQIVQGVVNLPISPTAALRISGLGNFRQGVNRNATNGKWTTVDRYAVRGRLLIDPGNALTVNLIGDYTRTRQTGQGDFFTFVKAGGPGLTPFGFPDPIGITARLASCGVTPREGNQDFCQAIDPRSHSENYGGSLQLDLDAGAATITSITALRRSNNDSDPSTIFRADPLQFRIDSGATSSNVKLFTQEIRIASPSNSTFEYTAGGFFSRQTAVTDPSTFLIRIFPAPNVAIPIVNTIGASNDVTDRSYAVFGQATLHATDALNIIAGGRYTDAKLSLATRDLATGVVRRQQLHSKEVSYRFGLQYDLAANAMAYATVSRGFKGGQISIPALPDQPFVLQPEIPQSYEAGVKATLFGGWIMDVNAFYEKVRNFQAQQCQTNSATGGLSCFNTNIDGVKSRGAELNFFGRISPALSLNTGFIYTKATYPGGYVGTDGRPIGGSQLAYAPKYKFTLSGEYEHPVSDGLKGFLAADTVWKSRLRYEANTVRDTTFRPHWLVGGRLGVRTSEDRFQLAVFARNLFNVHEPVLMQSAFPYASTNPNASRNVGAIYGPQSFRQVGLSLDGKF